MSSFTATSAASNTGQDRRSQTRRRLEELVYADFGPSNGGIILDMSEGGFAFQSVEPLEQRTTFLVNFKLPGVGTPTEAIAEPAWLIDSEKRGGLRFLVLAESMRREIKAWAAPEIRNKLSADIRNEFTQADPSVSGRAPDAKGVEPPHGAGHVRQRTAQLLEPATTAIDSKTVLSPPASSEAHLSASRNTPHPSTNPIISMRLQNSQAASVSAPAKPGQGPQSSSTSQILSLAIAAAFVAGTLAVIAAFPTLRTKFPGVQNNGAQITDNSSIETSDFHVEAVDRDGGRWILKDSETDAAPTTNASSRRDAQGAESLRNQAPKQPAAGAEAKAKTDLNEVPELTLNKPRRETTSDVAAADPRLPSIFEGVTPPTTVFDSGALAPAPPEPVQPLPAPSPRRSDLQGPTLIYRVAPLYPVAARQQRLQGEVRVRATVGKDGMLRNLKPLSGDPRLIPAALSAIGQWRYKPATLNGEAIESDVIVTTAFNLK